MEEIRCDQCRKADYQCEPCTRLQLSFCSCGSGETRHELCDCYGVFVAYVCGKCEDDVASRYNLDYSLTDLAECGEQLDPDY